MKRRRAGAAEFGRAGTPDWNVPLRESVGLAPDIPGETGCAVSALDPPYAGASGVGWVERRSRTARRASDSVSEAHREPGPRVDPTSASEDRLLSSIALRA